MLLVQALLPPPILAKTGMSAEQVDGMKSSIQSQVPIGRMGDPSEIARVATFFASDDSSFVLGTELIADGGMVTL